VKKSWSGRRAQAREIGLFRQGKFRDVKLAKQQAAKLENMFDQMAEGEVKNLPLIIKADVQGSQEALVQSLQKLSTDEVRVQVVHAAVGGISESTSTWRSPPRRSSSASTPVPTPRASWPKQRRGHPLLQHHLRRGGRGEGGDVRHAGAGEARTGARPGRNPPGVRGQQGRHDRRLLRARRPGQAWLASPPAAQQRGGLDGELDSLKRFKDDVKEVKSGFECGLSLKNYNDIKKAISSKSSKSGSRPYPVMQYAGASFAMRRHWQDPSQQRGNPPATPSADCFFKAWQT
jgi:translation initiation factor IF-2